VRACCKQALELLAPFHAALLPLLPALPSLWTHNDLHASNLLWSSAGDNAQATAIIDFGLADRTNAVHDLAQAIERNIVEWLAFVANPAHPEDTPVHLDHLEALLSGYASVRPLSSEEAAALAPMTALCHAEFALTEADYYLGALGSEENARVAYDDYLVGHARWFRASGGRRLLDAISQWAEQATEKLGPEGGGGFNPRIRPIESSGPLQAAENSLGVARSVRARLQSCRKCRKINAGFSP
jgi:Ser/Thr protein kinase RdoA (MazF antagonist)